MHVLLFCYVATLHVLLNMRADHAAPCMHACSLIRATTLPLVLWLLCCVRVEFVYSSIARSDSVFIALCIVAAELQTKLDV